MDSVYTDDMTFWHPFMSVQGKENMLGVARLWTFLCGHLEIDTKRVGEGSDTPPLHGGICSQNPSNSACSVPKLTRRHVIESSNPTSFHPELLQVD